MSDRMPDRMSEHMPERMSEYICHRYFHVVYQKLCQNSVSRWGSLEVKYFMFSLLVFVLLYMLHVICHVENWADQLKMKLFRLPYTVHTYMYMYSIYIYT